MKRMFFFMALMLCLSAGVAYAPLVTVTDDSDSGSGNEDTSVVDLSDADTDQPTWSPSFENTAPAGSAPGEPVTNDDED